MIRIASRGPEEFLLLSGSNANRGFVNRMRIASFVGRGFSRDIRYSNEEGLQPVKWPE